MVTANTAHGLSLALAHAAGQAAAAHAPHGALLLAALAAAGLVYRVSLWLHPFRLCRRCAGSGIVSGFFHAPEDVQVAVLSSLRRITPYTITEPARLRAQLVQVRADGYATTAEEMTLGACSVAVPVRRGDQVAAAVGIVVPTLRRDKARLVSALTVAAHGIGRSLGPQPGIMPR